MYPYFIFEMFEALRLVTAWLHEALFQAVLKAATVERPVVYLKK